MSETLVIKSATLPAVRVTAVALVCATLSGWSASDCSFAAVTFSKESSIE